jgi:hypothetical protein
MLYPAELRDLTGKSASFLQARTLKIKALGQLATSNCVLGANKEAAGGLFQRPLTDKDNGGRLAILKHSIGLALWRRQTEGAESVGKALLPPLNSLTPYLYKP